MKGAPVPTIVQIIPAVGWRYRLNTDDEGASWPLACFALVERDYGDGDPPERSVEGVDPNGDAIWGLVEEYPGCHAIYIPPGMQAEIK